MTLAVVAAVLVLALLAMTLVWLEPGLLVLVLLLPASQFFGVVDPMTLAVAGRFDIHALLIVLLVATALLLGGPARELRHGSFRAPVIVLILVWMIGTALPVLRGESTAWQAIEASKEQMMLFGYFATFLVVREARSIRVGWQALVFFGVGYSVLSILGQVAGPSVLAVLDYDTQPDLLGLTKIYIPFWPLILLGMYAGFTRWLAGHPNGKWVFALCTVGLVLTFFRSYLLASIVTLFFLAWMLRVPGTRLAAVGGSLALVGVLAVIVVGLGTGRGGVPKVADAFVLSGITELATGTGGALAGRAAYVQQLVAVTEQRPLGGYGFLNPESTGAARLPLESFAGSTLGFIDNGLADMIVKFGYGGATLVYLTWVVVLFRAVRMARAPLPLELRAMAATVAGTIATFLMVQPVHAPLSYSFGLLPLVLALALLDRGVLVHALRRRAG